MIKRGEWVEVSFTAKFVEGARVGKVQVVGPDGVAEDFFVPLSAITLASEADRRAKGGA